MGLSSTVSEINGDILVENAKFYYISIDFGIWLLNHFGSEKL